MASIQRGTRVLLTYIFPLETMCFYQISEMDCFVHRFENCQELDTWIIYVGFFEVPLRKPSAFLSYFSVVE